MKTFLVFLAWAVTYVGNGLQVTSKDLNATLTSTKFSIYFGKQTCEPVTAPVSALLPGDYLCGAPFKGNYSGTIVIVPDLVYPVEYINLPDGSRMDINTVGCSKETMYEKLVAAGVVGAVSYSFDPLPSSGWYMRGYAHHDPIIYDAIVVLSVKIADLAPVFAALGAGTTDMQMTLPCDEPNPMKPYLDAISILGITFGVLDVLLGIYGVLCALKIYPQCSAGSCSKTGDTSNNQDTGGSEGVTRLTRYGSSLMSGGTLPPQTFADTRPSLMQQQSVRMPKPKRKPRKRVHGQGFILLSISALALLVGFFRVLGFVNVFSHSYVVGDAGAAYPGKAFFGTGLVGFRFFTTCLVALFWWEMANAMNELRAVSNIFLTKKCVILFCFVVCVTPDFFFVISSATYGNGYLDTGIWVYASLSAVIALLFLFSVHNLLRLLKEHVSTVNHQTEQGQDSMRGIKKFALHMTFWLRAFALSSFAQILLCFVFFPTDFFTLYPVCLPIFYGALYLLSWISMFSKIQGLRGPRKSGASPDGTSFASSNSYRTNLHTERPLENVQVKEKISPVIELTDEVAPSEESSQVNELCAA
mmetsp:Transcript_25478/g.41099  ORF Transcript_25478/g.41099 Transcript_25478/m.41099 type:complete len:585 (-) Transcript_25478:48-1802(-)